MSHSSPVRAPSRRALLMLGVAFFAVIGVLLHHTGAASAFEVWMNDNFSGAALLPGASGATHDEPVGNQGSGSSVWYAWTPSGSGSATFTTATSSYDASLNLYSLNPVTMQLSPIGGAADTDGTHTAQFSVPVTGGAEYRMM